MTDAVTFRLKDVVRCIEGEDMTVLELYLHDRELGTISFIHNRHNAGHHQRICHHVLQSQQATSDLQVTT